VSVDLTWSGLEDFRTILRNIPKALHSEAIPIVDHATEATANQLLLNYPVGDTGNLRAGVRVEKHHEGGGVYDQVRSTSPHAHLWEFGTENRETAKGWKRGHVTPARDKGRETLIGIAIRNRERMDRELFGLLERNGFTVTGARYALR
jgi:hypothetical protein